MSASLILFIIAFFVAMVASLGPDALGPFKLLPLAVALIALGLAV